MENVPQRRGYQGTQKKKSSENMYNVGRNLGLIAQTVLGGESVRISLNSHYCSPHVPPVFMSGQRDGFSCSSAKPSSRTKQSHSRVQRGWRERPGPLSASLCLFKRAHPRSRQIKVNPELSFLLHLLTDSGCWRGPPAAPPPASASPPGPSAG